MDVALLVLVALVSAGTTGVVVYRVNRQSQEKLPRTYRRRCYTYAGKWRLPPPNVDLGLYKKVNRIFNELEAEKSKALLESSELQERVDSLSESNDELREENERLCDMLEMAQDVIRSHTHPGMKLTLPPDHKSRRQRETTTI